MIPFVMGDHFKDKAERLFRNPWMDKIVAAALVSESLWLTLRVMSERHGLALLILVVRTTVCNGFLLIRRGPRRITVAWSYWLVAIAEAYWDLVYALFRNRPYTALVPEGISDGLALASVALLVLARLNLGRSFGIVPADRGIKRAGIYRVIRHPIYTAAIVGALGYVLGHFSPENASVFGLGIVLVVWKTLNEEKFLSGNPEYVDYMRAVRFRFFPLVA